jgi:hypothetical protein
MKCTPIDEKQNTYLVSSNLNKTLSSFEIVNLNESLVSSLAGFRVRVRPLTVGDRFRMSLISASVNILCRRVPNTCKTYNTYIEHQEQFYKLLNKLLIKFFALMLGREVFL